EGGDRRRLRRGDRGDHVRRHGDGRRRGLEPRRVSPPVPARAQGLTGRAEPARAQVLSGARGASSSTTVERASGTSSSTTVERASGATSIYHSPPSVAPASSSR